MRIALLNPCYWPEVRRGTERFLHDLATGLVAGGHRVRLITSHPGLPRRTVEEGFEVVRNWRPPERPLRLLRYEQYLTHVPASYASLRAGDDDLAHAAYPTDALAAVRWRRRTGRPVVFSMMGIAHPAALAGARKRREIMTRAASGADAVVVLSRAAAAEFEGQIGVQPRVIPPGVDLELFSPLPEARAPAPTIFCGAALDVGWKRVALLVKAFGLVREARPDARLVLSRPRDPRAAERIGAVGTGIELRDVDDRPELVGAYRGAWVSALPSEGEAFGLVLLEALACGTPVVGAASGALPEVVDNDAIGRLFQGDDPRALATAVLDALELVADPATPAACRARAADFSAQRCVAAYERLYEELLA